MRRVVMKGCKKHSRIRACLPDNLPSDAPNVQFIAVTPEFFNQHANGHIARIEQVMCDECLREVEHAASEISQGLARAHS